MSLKNKSVKQDNYKKGNIVWTVGWFGGVVKRPEYFYNSDEYRKIKNRKIKNRNKGKRK